MNAAAQWRISRRQVFPANRTPLMVQRVQVDGDHQPHDHDFLEIAVISGGSGQHLSPRGEQTLTPGDVFLLRPGSWHTYRDCHGLEVYNCCFGTELLQGELAALSQTAALHYLFWAGPLSLEHQGLIALHLPPEALGTCRTHLDAIAWTMSEEPAASILECFGHLLLFLAQLARCLGPEYRVPDSSLPAPPHPAVLEGRRLLEDRLAHPWTLPELARELCIAPAYLARLFKENAGLPPMAYLTRCRAERAARLLLRTSKSISEIAEEIGWPDSNYFARRFKACFGLSATVYRARFTQSKEEFSVPAQVQ